MAVPLPIERKEEPHALILCDIPGGEAREVIHSFVFGRERESGLHRVEERDMEMLKDINAKPDTIGLGKVKNGVLHLRYLQR